MCEGDDAMEDSAIVQLYWTRNETAISHTERKYGAYLLKIAYNILADREDSQESVNDTYLAAWDSIPPQRPGVLSTYLGKLTRRISIDIFRRKSSQKRGGGEYALSLEELGDCVSGGTDPEKTAESKALGQAIGNFLESQPGQVRQVFIGRYYYMDPVKEIARYCRISESKVKILLYRARQDLREYLQKEGFSV